MRFGGRSRAGRLLSVEITPMIDVVFLLIIFFMTTARFAQVTRADLDLPRERGEQEEQSEEAGTVINVTADGAIVVAGRELTLEDLDRHVRGEIGRMRDRDPRQLKVLLRADRNAASGRLNQVVTLLRRLGVGAARIATEVP